MTRRDILKFPAAFNAIGQGGCHADSNFGMRRLREYEEKRDLAVLARDLEVYTGPGGVTGRLALSDYVGLMSVSPDARSVAWVRLNALSQPPGHEPPVVLIRSDTGAFRTVRCPFALGAALAISSDTRRAVVSTFASSVSGRLLVLNTESSEVERDLTSPIDGFSIKEIERLSISNDGARLAVGSRSTFLLIEVPAQTVILRSTGRFPTLSPGGQRLAYVDPDHEVFVTEVAKSTGASLARMRACGVGSWSPDGTLLLAGGWTRLSWWKRLVVIDRTDKRFVELAKLGEGDLGDRCLWISRQLLASGPEPGAGGEDGGRR